MVRSARNPEMINIESRLPRLIEFLKGRGVLAAWIFGSYGTPEQTPLSDVDLALLFRRGAEPELEEELRLAGEVSEIVREDDINLVILNRAPVTLQMRVLETGRLLFEEDRIAVSDFMEWVTKRFGDFMPDLMEFYRDYDESLREAYLHDR